MSWAVLLWAVAGCYSPPDLPLLEQVPIEGPDFIPCADDIEDVRVACTLTGDSFDVEECFGGDDVRYRLLGVAAPEPGDCYGDDALDWLTNTIGSEVVTLTFDTVCVDGDEVKLAYVWARGDLYDDLARDRNVEDLTRDYGDDEPAVMLNEVVLRLGVGRRRDEEIPGGLYYGPDFEAAATAAEADRLGLYLACGAEG